MTSCYRPMLDGLGLTYPPHLVLVLLRERGDLSVTGIGHALRLEAGMLSPLLKRLEATGLVTRTRQAGDERSVLVGLTSAGRDLEKRAADVQRNVESVTGLDDAEITASRSTLQGIARSLRVAAGR